jgi:hypothetical protein
MTQYERQFSEAVNTPVPLETLVSWARTPESRRCWPGSSGVRAQGTAIFFDLDMQAPGGPPATGVMEEHLRPPEATAAGVRFESGLALTWPSHEMASGDATYQFERCGEATKLSFAISYFLPRKIGGARFNRGRFLDAVDRALSLYVNRLAHGPSVQIQARSDHE